MKLFSKIVLLLLVGASALTGCKKDKEKVKDDDSFYDELYDPGKGVYQENKKWLLSLGHISPDVRNSMSVTTIIKGLQTQVQENDRLLAYIDETCCGIATPLFEEGDEDPYFFLLVSLTEEEMKTSSLSVELRYYSEMSGKLYTAKDPILFETDAIIGGLGNPYMPVWK